MKKGRILIVLVIAVLMLLPACGDQQGEPADDNLPSDKVSSDWDSEKMGLKTPFDNREEFENGEDGKTIEVIWERFNHPEIDVYLEEYAPQLIIRGTVLGFDMGEYETFIETFGPSYPGLYPSEPDDSSSDDPITLYTMYHVEPTEILRGEPKTTENGLIDVFMFGGQEGTHMFYREGPVLTVGDEYVFMLFDPIIKGDCYNTNNAGYYGADPVTGECAVFVIYEENQGDAMEPYSEGDFGISEISYDEFKEKVDALNASVPLPTDIEMRQTYVADQRMQLEYAYEHGATTQEQYELSKAWLDAYESYTE